jgi:hypothetical protein
MTMMPKVIGSVAGSAWPQRLRDFGRRAGNQPAADRAAGSA